MFLAVTALGGRVAEKQRTRPDPQVPRQAAARLFSRLQNRYAQQRAQWLAGWLENELLGSLLADLRRGAEVPTAEVFCEVESLAAALSQQSEDSPRGS